MLQVFKDVGDPKGFGFGGPIIITVLNRDAALSVGEVAAIDTSLSDADATNFQVGDDNSGLYNVVAPATAECLSDGVAPIVMALEEIATDATGRALVKGRVPLKHGNLNIAAITVQDSNVGNNNALVGDRLIVTNGSIVLDVDQDATGRIVGQVLVTATVDVSTDPVPVYFNGLDFLGLT